MDNLCTKFEMSCFLLDLKFNCSEILKGLHDPDHSPFWFLFVQQ